MPQDHWTLWRELAARADLALSQAQLTGFDRYLQLLTEGNLRMNLTSITEPSASATLHVADALTLLPFLPARGHSLGDVGSGGGVPGIILALARPDAAVTLIESTKKKAAFLRETAAMLQLPNVQVIDQRAEQLGRGGERRRFDVVTARAVAPLAQLAQWCLPLLRPGGRLLAMKGGRYALEMPDALGVIRRLRGRPPVVHPTPLPGAEGHVVIEIALI